MPHALRAAAVACVCLSATQPRPAHAQDDQVAGLTITAQPVLASGMSSPATNATVYAGQLQDTINLINPEDALRFFPSLTVRKRHVGDTQAPLATRTSGLGASARSLIFADGLLLSAPIGNNNSFASPRWGMISPDQIARVDVSYGPFSAAYGGGSIGAVVNYSTRMPSRLEGHFTAAQQRQDFSLYGTSGTYPVKQLAGSIGDRIGVFAWRLGENHVDSQSQPLSLATVTRPGAPSSAGRPVTGAFVDRNRTGAPLAVVGAGGFEHQAQDSPTLKLTYELGPHLALAYTGGVFLNRTRALAQAYLRDGAGSPVYTGAVNIGGYAYNLSAGTLSNGLYRLDERHRLNAVSAKGAAGPWTYQATLSDYDYAKDDQRLATSALPGALAGGAGTITRMGGTGWRTGDLQGTWSSQNQTIAFGAHLDRAQLANRKFNTVDWRSGPATALATASLGQTVAQALWIQDALKPRADITLTLGARLESWSASKGYNYSLSPGLNVAQPKLSADGKLSPKATLAWGSGPGWKVSLSYGEAYRFPTVSELYQAVTTGANLSVPNPNLRPEHARTVELAAEYDFGPSDLRVSIFNERIIDALVSQAGLLGGANVNFVQNIDQTQVTGLEIAFEQRDLFIRGFDLSGAYTLVDPTVQRDAALAAVVGRDLPGIPRNRASLTATYRPSDQWSVSLGARYSDRAYASIDNSDVYPHTWQGFDKYLVLDARANLRLARGWSLAAGVDNLTDKRYFLFHPFPGRTASLELHYDY